MEGKQKFASQIESTFGELDNKVTLGDAVMSAAQNAAEDNLPDYLNDLIYASEDSFLEGLLLKILRTSMREIAIAMPEPNISRVYSIMIIPNSH